VVWQGSAGDRRPYADLTALSNARSNLRYAPHFLVRASDKALT